MYINQTSQLLGIRINQQNKKEALELSLGLLFKIIQLFKKHSFGLITLYKIGPDNFKDKKLIIGSAEELLSSRGIKFYKIDSSMEHQI